MQIMAFILVIASLGYVICADSSDINVRDGIIPENLMQTGKYAEAEQSYRLLLKTQKSAEFYAGLVESLLMQNEVREAHVVLNEAGEKNFSSNVNILAVSGHAFFMSARTVSLKKFPAYLEGAVVASKRALAIDPTNQIALRTLGLVEERSKKLEKAAAFEKADKLDSAVGEYESLLKERSGDFDAFLGIERVRRLKNIQKDDVAP